MMFLFIIMDNDVLERDGVVNELHAPIRRNFPCRKYIVKGLYDLYQADLIDMRKYAVSNTGYQYLLVVINVFSKFA